MMAADAPSSHEFCVFDLPGCKGCPKAQHTVRSLGSSEDPMKSEVWHAWIARVARPKLFAPIREVSHGYGEVHSRAWMRERANGAAARAYPQGGAKVRNVKLGRHAALTGHSRGVKLSSTVRAAPRPAIRCGKS